MMAKTLRATPWLALCAAVAWLALAAAAAHAVPITGLFNTGVNNAGNAFPIGGIPDPHYLVTVSPGGPFVPVTVTDTAFPFPPWAPNNPFSRWIGPAANGNGPAGLYRYRTTFNLPNNADLSSAMITGLWGTDDNSLGMRLNGNLTPNVSAGFQNLVPFMINSGFQHGLNVITFDLNNAGGPTGLRIDNIVGKYNIIPEPATAGIAVIGAAAFFAVRRRRRRLTSSSTGENRMIHRCHRTAIALLFGLISFAGYLASGAKADPLPGRDLLKFSQQPMITTTVTDANGTPGVYYGHDELSTAYGFANAAAPPIEYQGRFMADDFADNLSSPVVHVKWWGSYRGDVINPNFPVNKFLVAFESDIPAGPAPSFSMPGSVLQYDVVSLSNSLTPGSGQYTEKLIRGPDPILGESLYEYNAELHLGREFFEKQDTVYWLKIAALVDVPSQLMFDPYNPPPNMTQWGWHNRDYTIQDTLASPNVAPGEFVEGFVGANQPVWHFQDDAVSGTMRILAPNGLANATIFQTNMQPQLYLDNIDGPAAHIPGTTGIGQMSKDLAFELYTIVPEPAAGVLLLFGCTGLLAVRRQRGRLTAGV